MTPTVAKHMVRKRRRRMIFILAGLLVLLSFMAKTLFGESGILVGLQVKSEYTRLKARQAELEAENKRLKEEIRAIKSDPRHLEAIGREEFGFARPGEVVYTFPEDEEEKP